MMKKEDYEKVMKVAYQLVYNDMVASGPRMFRGHYDAKNGDCSFMYGICTVMEYIADKADPDIYDEFSTLFVKNMNESEKGA